MRFEQQTMIDYVLLRRESIANARLIPKFIAMKDHNHHILLLRLLKPMEELNLWPKLLTQARTLYTSARMRSWIFNYTDVPIICFIIFERVMRRS